MATDGCRHHKNNFNGHVPLCYAIGLQHLSGIRRAVHAAVESTESFLVSLERPTVEGKGITP